MVGVGLIGVGFMGWIHYLAYRRSSSASLVAFASRDPSKRAGDWRGIQGNFGPPGEQIDLRGIHSFESLAELLQHPGVEVVDICLPPHMHVESAIQALEHGKHVFCEKPLALNTSDCDRILSAARASNRQVMVAQVLPYIGPFRFALEVAKSGRYGKPIGGHFKRIISNPSWIPDFYVRDRVGGPMVDLHVHDTHFISLVFGMPKAVTAVGRVHGSVAKFAHALFHFDDASLAVAASTGVIDQDGRPFTHGFELTLERATIHFEFAALADHAETMDLKVLTPDGRVERPSLAASDDVSAFVDEIADMAASVTGGIARPNLAGDTARDAIHLTHAVQDSVLQNRTIMV